MRFRVILLVTLAFAITCVRAAEPGDEVVSNIARLPVYSSALSSVGYSRQQQILEVEFLTGAVYRYLDVPQQVFREMLDAPSKAGYYNANIRGKYRSLHVKRSP